MIQMKDLYDKYNTKRQNFYKKSLNREITPFTYEDDEVKTKIFAPSNVNFGLCSDINEYYLFHGTSKEITMKIIQDGLDYRVSSGKAMFGIGIYLAESSTKADQYVGCNKINTIIIVRTILGNIYRTKEPMNGKKRPPCLKCDEFHCDHTDEKYDSVLGRFRNNGKLLNFREFVVYDRNQCYPEYLVEYERIE